MGSKAISGSVEATKCLQSLGKQLYLVSNSPIKARAELLEIAQKLGYDFTIDQILTAGYVTAKYLNNLNFTKKVYLVGYRSILNELTEFGIQCIENNDTVLDDRRLYEIFWSGAKLDADVGAVVVSFDPKFNYTKLFEASNYVRNPECLFIATSTDEMVPTSGGSILPLMGPIVRSIEVASDRKATVIGKPSVHMFQALPKLHNIVPDRTLMVGDSLNYDILFGHNLGLQTMLVGSGVNSLNDVHLLQKSNTQDDQQLIPDVYLSTLGDIGSLDISSSKL